MNFLDEGEQPSCHVCGQILSREPMPKRIQRRRTKGWKMPPSTVYVGRPTTFGNPFLLTESLSVEKAVAMFRNWLTKSRQGLGGLRRVNVLTRMPELRGKDLACWCRLDQPCHADVLLEIANKNRIWKCSCGASTGVKD